MKQKRNISQVSRIIDTPFFHRNLFKGKFTRLPEGSCAILTNYTKRGRLTSLSRDGRECARVINTRVICMLAAHTQPSAPERARRRPNAVVGKRGRCYRCEALLTE